MVPKILPFIAAFTLLACNDQSTTDTKSSDSKMNNPAFKTADWVHNTNVYEVNLRQYTAEGTFNAFAKELPRLKAMGVETLWFMPITPIAQKNMKGPLGSYYATSNYTAINSEFGSMDDFKSLVKLAHSMGFKVMLDWVANHTGWDHIWTTQHPEYYLKDSVTKDFKIASGMDDIIELDFKNPELRRAMIDAMKFWVTKFDIDGYRCDLASWVELDFWVEARAEIDKTKNILWLAEADPLENPDYLKVFDAAYTWSWMHKTKDYYQGKADITELKTLLARYDSVSGNNKIPLWFTTNHDENSWNGTEYEKYGDMARTLAVFSFTWNGMPLIYSGQELPNKKRLEFFKKDPIEWTGKYELEDFYRTLLALKKNNPALRTGDGVVTTVLLNTDAGKILAYLRKNGNNEVLVLLNLSKERTRFELKADNVTGNYRNVFSKIDNDFTSAKFFEMQPWEFLVYEKK